MSKRVWASAACALWLGCGDAVVGSVHCVDGIDTAEADGGCSNSNILAPTLLNVPFIEVATGDATDLSTSWQIDSPCAKPCQSLIQLYRAGPDAVWAVPRDRPAPTLDLIDATSMRTSLDIGPAPANSGPLSSSYVTVDQTGNAIVHTQWLGVDGRGGGPDAIYVAQGLPGPTLLGSIGLKPPRSGLPSAAIAVPAGFLLFDGSSAGSADIYLLDPEGGSLWQRSSYPKFADRVGASALHTSAGYVLGASNGESNAAYGVLSIDDQGVYGGFAYTNSSHWRNVTIQSWRGGEYAVAASSDLNVQSLPGAGTGNVDVLMFSDLYHPSGYRLKRSCVNELTVNGFTSDASGTLYVSSVSGTGAEPRGIICRLPWPLPSAVAQCFQAPVNVLFGQIVASDSGALFAVMGPFSPSGDHSADQIVRIQLPR